MLLGNVTLTCVIILVCATSVSPYKCYQCRSDIDKNCKKTVSKQYLKECSKSKRETPTEPTVVTEKDSNQTVDITSVAPIEDESNDTIQETNGYTCRVVIQVLYIKKPSEKVYIRECTKGDYKSGCSTTSNKLLYISACNCRQEGCNRSERSTSVSISLVLLGFTIFLV